MIDAVARLVLPARQAYQRYQQVREPAALRAAAEDVQPVADLHLLELAEVGVELGERPIGPLGGGEAAVPIEAEVRGEPEDLVAKDREPPRVYPPTPRSTRLRAARDPRSGP